MKTTIVFTHVNCMSFSSLSFLEQGKAENSFQYLYGVVMEKDKIDLCCVVG